MIYFPDPPSAIVWKDKTSPGFAVTNVPRNNVRVPVDVIQNAKKNEIKASAFQFLALKKEPFSRTLTKLVRQ